MKNIVVVAIATGPDLDGARRLQDFGSLDDDGVVRALAAQQLQRHGSASLPIVLQRVIGLGAVRDDPGGPRLWRQPAARNGEADHLRALIGFAAGAAWIGWGGQEWPVLRCRALVHSLVVPGVWPAQPAPLDLMPAIFGAGVDVALEDVAGLLAAAPVAAPADDSDPFATCARTAVQTFCVYRAWQVARGECARDRARQDEEMLCADLRRSASGCRDS